MGEQSYSKNNDNKTLTEGVDTGAVAPGGTVRSNARPNPQTGEDRSFQADKGGETEGPEERIKTSGDDRWSDPDVTRPSAYRGGGAPSPR